MNRSADRETGRDGPVHRACGDEPNRSRGPPFLRPCSPRTRG